MMLVRAVWACGARELLLVALPLVELHHWRMIRFVAGPTLTNQHRSSGCRFLPKTIM